MARWDKFRDYWESIGNPQLEAGCEFLSWGLVKNYRPKWLDNVDYRIAGDPHWKLRLKWVDSDFKLLIQYTHLNGEWWDCSPTYGPDCWDYETQYREKPL